MRIVATRLHTSNEKRLLEGEDIKQWCDHVLNYCDLLIVIVDTKYLNAIQNAQQSFQDRIQFFHIDPWISFTQPLNMLVEKALSLGAKELLFQSIEVEISLKDIEKLESHLTNDTLVVGAKLDEQHGSDENIQLPLNGWTTPWNTLALWNIQKLGLIGFLSISSGNHEGIPGGVEEVVTISMLQSLKQNEMKAKVINLQSVVWNTTWDCDERAKYHKEKMQSKEARSIIQLETLGIKAGQVQMIHEES
jgi:hypothetical protein